MCSQAQRPQKDPPPLADPVPPDPAPGDRVAVVVLGGQVEALLATYTKLGQSDLEAALAVQVMDNITSTEKWVRAHVHTVRPVIDELTGGALTMPVTHPRWPEFLERTTEQHAREYPVRLQVLSLAELVREGVRLPAGMMLLLVELGAMLDDR